MSLVADESIDRPIVERLRRRGLEATFVAELEPGLHDDAVLALANERNALLLTGDKDFGELAFRLGRVTAGVVLVRLAGLKPTGGPRSSTRAWRDSVERCPMPSPSSHQEACEFVTPRRDCRSGNDAS